MELKDVQNKQDKRGIDIQKVGIKDVQVPLLVQRKNDKNQIVNAKARMSVSLDKNFKGTHMSRFMEVLGEYSKNSLDLKSMLESLKKKRLGNQQPSTPRDWVKVQRIPHTI